MVFGGLAVVVDLSIEEEGVPAIPRANPYRYPRAPGHQCEPEAGIGVYDNIEFLGTERGDNICERKQSRAIIVEKNLVNVPVVFDKLFRVFADEDGNVGTGKMLLQNPRHGKSKNDIADSVGPNYEYPEVFIVQSMRFLMNFPIKYTERWGELQKALNGRCLE
jgi:hypothetical protein